MYSKRTHTNYITKVQRDNSKDMTELWFETMSYFTTYTSLCIVVMYTHTQIYVYSYNTYYLCGSCNSQTKATTGEQNNNFPTNKIEIRLVSTRRRQCLGYGVYPHRQFRTLLAHTPSHRSKSGFTSASFNNGARQCL